MRRVRFKQDGEVIEHEKRTLRKEKNKLKIKKHIEIKEQKLWHLDPKKVFKKLTD